MTQHNCLKHGVYYPVDYGTAADCPRCAFERKAQAGPEPLTPEAKAVLEAAVEFHRKRYCNLTGDKARAMEALISSIEAYLATQKPKGVDPQTVRPGTRFRFAAPSWKLDYNDPRMVIAEGDLFISGKHRYVNLLSGGIYNFDDEDRIIPLPHQDTTEEDR